MKRRTTLKVLAGSASFVILPPSFLNAAAHTPKFFSAEEMILLGALSEAIIPPDEHSPGAIAADVPAYIDTIVSEGDDRLKQSWSRGLKGIDAVSKAAHGTTFANCTPVQQTDVLHKIAANEHHPVTAEEQFFVKLKRATVDGYYTSSIGIHQDLEYQGNQMVHDFQACVHDEHTP